MHGTPTQPGTFEFTVEASQIADQDPKCFTQWGFTRVTIRDRLERSRPRRSGVRVVGAPYTAPVTVVGNEGNSAWAGRSAPAPSRPVYVLAADGAPAEHDDLGHADEPGTSRSR